MNYSNYVAGLIKPMPVREHFAHMAMGLSGEAGEVTDIIKKHFAYGSALDKRKLELELGDVLFYLVGIALTIGSSLEDVMEKNQEKLMRRYPDGYTNDAAIARKDVIMPLQAV